MAIQLIDGFIQVTVWGSVGFFGLALVYHAMFGFKTGSQAQMQTVADEAWSQVEEETSTFMQGAGSEDDWTEVEAATNAFMGFIADEQAEAVEPIKASAPVIDIEPVETTTVEYEVNPWLGLTIRQLKAYARHYEVTGYSRLTKPALAATLYNGGYKFKGAIV